ncbi:guanine deaminase [soil metagenome]
MITDREKHFMYLAIEQSKQGMQAGDGGPFGCVVVKGDEVVGAGHNKVLCNNDPTAHAEVVAIRDACSRLETFQLDDCEVYCSCEPCPMCFGAIYWARPAKVFYANTKADAASIGFDDQFIYDQLKLPLIERKIPLIAIDMPDALKIFQQWRDTNDKKLY